VHGDFAGGAEWIPRQEWLVQPAAYRLEGVYGLQRPVYEVDDVVNALATAGEEKEQDYKTTAEYCKGAVKNLDWEGGLWRRWFSWMKAGLKEEGLAE